MSTRKPSSSRRSLRPSAESLETRQLLSALSTVGSIVGTFLTVLYLIPTIGTARTTYLIAAFLIVVGIIGLRDWRYLLMLLVVTGIGYACG